MSDELIYTSAVRGLRPGTSGFCTVAATAGLGPAWQQRLEGVSGYKALYPVGHPQAGANPVAFAHTILTVAGQTRSVLTRAAFAGADHTGRTNKFVHHLLPTERERGPGGPAFILRQPGVMSQSFAGEPRPLTAGRAIPTARPAPAPAVAWQQATGDAAWAAALATVAIGDPSAIAYVLYAPGTDVLALFDEALRLLPEPRRWAVTFNTYVTESPAAPCAWRGIVAGTPAAALAKGTVIDLTNLNPAEVPTGALAEAARTGRVAAMDTPRDRDDQPRPVWFPSNVQISDLSTSSTPVAPVSSAVTPMNSDRRHSIPSNVRLAETRMGTSKSRAAIIVSIAAAVLLCLTAVGVGFWITKSTTFAQGQPTTTPSTTGSAAKKRAAAEQAAAAAIKALEAASEASKAATAAKEAADKAAKEKADADKSAAEAAEKKKSADEAAAKAKEAAEKTAKDAEAAKKAADDAAKEAERKKAEADKASADADAAEEFERSRLIIALPKGRDIPVEWQVSEKPKLLITEAKAVAISQAFCAKPWSNDRVPLNTFVTSVTFKIDVKDDRFPGVLDNKQLSFTVSVNGDTVACDYAEKYKNFADEVLKQSETKLADKTLNSVQIKVLKETLESMSIKDCRVKLTVPGSGSYFVKIKPSL